MIGVSPARKQVLLRNSLPVPSPVPVRATIDTGAYVSGFTPRVFSELGIDPVGRAKLITPSTPITEPHECDQFDISFFLVAEGRQNFLSRLRVVSTDSWHPSEGFETLIGQDILRLCFFQYRGLDKKFTLAF